jgi:hypothetical protein
MFLRVRTTIRATHFGAYAWVGQPATSVLTKAQLRDGGHNFSRPASTIADAGVEVFVQQQ